MHRVGKRYIFKATVAAQISARRFKLKDVYNVTLDKPFRYHLWADTEESNFFRGAKVKYFEAEVFMYQKKSGKWRFGLKGYKIIQPDENRL